MLTDSLGLKGYFKIESFDKDNKLIDTFEDYNLIMDNGRKNLASLCSGFIGGFTINKFVLGTQGTSLSSVTPKTEIDGFISSRTNLFSEDTSDYKYTLLFTPTINGDFASVTETDVGSGSTVKVTQTNSLVNYEISISGSAGNNTGIVGYTEGAFYAGDNIFAMRCFPLKSKDITTKLVISWSFQF